MKTSCTARTNPSSSVKRSRSQLVENAEGGGAYLDARL